MEHHGNNGEDERMESDYQARQDVRDAEYRTAWNQWIKCLSDAKLRQLAELDVDSSECSYNTHTPDYEQAHVDPPADDDEPDIPITSEAERLAMILLYLADSRNPRLELFVLMWAFGFPSMLGLTQEAAAAKFGLGKAGFSKRVKLMQQRFQLPPNRAMKRSPEYKWTNGKIPNPDK